MNGQWLVLPLGLVFIYLAIQRDLLTRGGAIAAYILGCWVVLLLGWRAILPLLFFMLSSIAIGRIWARRQEVAADAKHGRGRDAWQVVCNGGIYGGCALGAALSGDAVWLLLMTVSAAVSTADTWASEIGMGLRRPTYDILRWRRLPVGVSGGVSLAGTLAGAAGALALALLHALLWPASGSVAELGFIAAAGFAGMLIDSLLGAGIQARYQEKHSGQLRDTATAHTRLSSGWKWMTNDGVNLMANTVTTTVAGILSL